MPKVAINIKASEPKTTMGYSGNTWGGGWSFGNIGKDTKSAADPINEDAWGFGSKSKTDSKKKGNAFDAFDFGLGEDATGTKDEDDSYDFGAFGKSGKSATGLDTIGDADDWSLGLSKKVFMLDSANEVDLTVCRTRRKPRRPRKRQRDWQQRRLLRKKPLKRRLPQRRQRRKPRLLLSLLRVARKILKTLRIRTRTNRNTKILGQIRLTTIITVA